MASLAGASSPMILAKANKIKNNKNNPVILSTWNFGIPANEEAMKVLKSRGSAMDAAEAGARNSENDPLNTSVGLGGLPDEKGHVTLDSCVMDHTGNCGAVAFLQNIKHPISVARKVMENTDHVMLAGKGAHKFAIENGFSNEDLLTEKSKNGWLEWKKNNNIKDTWGPNDDHDTITSLAQDNDGNIAGACTTSGLAYKLHGRVGDSPIIGAGMYVDNEIGAAGATGVGELVMKTCGSFLVVELMRQGFSAMEACNEAVNRIVKQEGNKTKLQVGYIAL